jgi:preprotein translocase subunit SecG
MGGQSAFGAKSGDMFTKITVGVAAAWILLCVVTLKVVDRTENRLGGDLGAESVPSEDPTLRQGPGDATPADARTGAEPADGGEGASEPAAPADGAGGDDEPASGDDTSATP